MTTPTLPVDGQTPWGDELNTGILAVNQNAINAESSIASHAGNIPADPHGDRSYAQSLVSPITSGVNGPNGFVKLNSSGKILAALVNNSAGGAFTSIYDAVAQYSVSVGSGSDQSVNLQNALTAAGNAGGGIVWVGGNGAVSLGNYVVIPNNVTLFLGPQVILKRISTPSTPPYLITNVKFGTSNTPSTNIKVIGGSLDATNNGVLSNACTPIFIIQSSRTIIEDVSFTNVFSNPCIEINGCKNTDIDSCEFDGTNKSSGSAASKPAIRINSSESANTPVGLAAGIYNNAFCKGVTISSCMVADKSSTFGPFASLVGSDLAGTSQHSRISVIGSDMPYNDNVNGQLSINTSGIWTAFSVAGCNLPESSGSDGWNTIILQNSWTPSGVGPGFQWRWTQQGSAGGSSIPGIGNTIEIIGDVVAGTITNGTNIGSLPGYVSVGTGQIITVIFPAFTPPNAARLFFDNTTNHIVCENMSGSTGQRIFFHSFISITA